MPTHDARDSGTSSPASVRPFQVRGRFLTAIALRIETDQADDGFYSALDAQLQQTPQFFTGAPMVLDFEKAPAFVQPEQIHRLVDELRQRRLQVFGVQNAGDAQRRVTDALGLIPIANGREAPLPEARRAPAAAPASAPDAPAPAPRPATENKLITAPVRSGQTVVAEHGDLTILGSVASGAELVAAGNIHVYGPLRGRAMAGVHGDEDARIFCQHLDAELLAIAGLYRTSDTIEAALRKKAVQIFLDDDRLRMEALG
ncbi:septum site-determining protein MinC [Pseudooceanicola sp. CBS1P-1]|uniref:Probable septum site-determining protein MinC n=1 Tax=Pseudooceanicola albus TaxID=2692189 RepID=A0A6L7G0C9_9RHOB|nr:MULTISPECIES: septum site-determining protein MinC [Pseudooceanicola]MBT9382439.1 septum site-determining protein MinC [Pseudooceanicola endophyticus]MXN16980.1 septum formation inhibitor MinC [Pseudooceanicola albus]